jgi:hypothetical protein
LSDSRGPIGSANTLAIGEMVKDIANNAEVIKDFFIKRSLLVILKGVT